MVFKFSDSQYHNEVDLLNKIDDERIDVQAYSHPDRALEMARDQLFTAGGGDRPDKANLLIVLTDGELWYEALNGPPPEEEFNEFLDAISQDLNVSSCAMSKYIYIYIYFI